MPLQYRQHIIDYKGLGDYAVYFARGDFFEFVQGGHEEDFVALASGGFGVELLADFFAAHSWHHDVEEDEVVLVAAQDFQGFEAVAGHAQGEALIFEHINHHVADDGVVIDNQHFTCFAVQAHVFPPFQLAHLCMEDRS